MFEFSNFTLAPNERLLLCGEDPVPLAPKAFDLLVALVRRSGHLVTKDELLRQVWPDTFVEEVNLTVNVSALRRALGREGNRAELIQTVPKRGYRFVAPLVMRETAVAYPLPQADSGRSAWPVTGNADAYLSYQQGRHYWSRRSEEDLKRAMVHFDRAVDIDPQFAAAHSGLADCNALLGYLSYVSPMEAFPAAERHASRALELDESLSEAHASLGFVHFYFEWNWAAAEAEFQRAIALDADYAATHQWYSIFLLALGRDCEAFHEIQIAHRRDALSVPVNTDLGFYYYYTGQYDKALKQLKFTLEMNPDFAPAHLWLGRTYQEMGWFEDAIAEFRRVEEKVPNWPVAIAARGFVAGVAGRTDEALEILTELNRLAGRKFVTSYGMALVHAGIREDDAAFAWLDRAIDERSNWLVWLRLDPRWKKLRPDPRFAELLERVGFPR